MLLLCRHALFHCSVCRRWQGYQALLLASLDWRPWHPSHLLDSSNMPVDDVSRQCPEVSHPPCEVPRPRPFVRLSHQLHVPQGCTLRCSAVPWSNTVFAPGCKHKPVADQQALSIQVGGQATA